VSPPNRVLLLGGGFVAMQACRAMRTAIRQGRLDVTVVTRDNFLCLHGLIGEMLTGRIGPGTILNPSRRIFAPAELHIGEIESIDIDARRVVTSRHLDGARFELDYDQAVIGVGSAENLEAYPGLAEHAYRLKSFHDCFHLRNHILEMFELADIESDPVERRRLLTFFVAGGGFSGTEIAGELADFVRLLTEREYPRISRDECRVVIVHPGPTLLPELYGSSNAERPVRGFPGLVEYGTRHASKLGVELMLETRVVGATPNEVRLSNGVHVPTRTIVSVVGTKPSPLLDQLPLARDARGRLVTDQYLRVEGRVDFWAGGDCASVPHPDGGTCPPVALFALKHGERIGDNISRQESGRPLRPFRAKVLGQGASIGRRTAVGEIKGRPMRGRLAWLAWRSVIWQVTPSWDRRLRLLADWIIWPLVGRDVVQMGRPTSGDYEIRHSVYQEGEVIADRARPVRYVHVILEGETDVLGPTGVTLATLGPGDHFGRKWLEMSGGDAVRARSLVRTIALRADQANRLQHVLASAGRLIARTESFPVITDEAREQSRE
jgi:NADH:quinone reductase (non-electrogenic)